MSLADILKERREVKAAFSNLKETIKTARPNGITAEEAAEIAEATADFVGEVCDLVNVALENRTSIIDTIKSHLRPLVTG